MYGDWCVVDSTDTCEPSPRARLTAGVGRGSKSQGEQQWKTKRGIQQKKHKTKKIREVGVVNEKSVVTTDRVKQD